MANDCLVIGCGYLGLRVAQLWLRQQHAPVYVTTRKADRAEELRRAGFAPLICDVLDPESLGQLPRHVSKVLFSVGIDRSAGASMRAVYVQGLSNVLDHLQDPGQLVYISSTSVYGQTDGSLVDETGATEPLEESGRIVLEAETLLRSRLREAVILRFAGMYGPGRLLREQAIRTGQALAVDPEKWLNLIYIDDGVAVVASAFERAAPGSITNVADGHPVTRRDYYTELSRVLAAPPPNFVAAVDPKADPVNRRIATTRLRRWQQLHYPDYRAGLAQAVASLAQAGTDRA